MAISWADPERRQALKRKFAGETEPERQVGTHAKSHSYLS